MTLVALIYVKRDCPICQSLLRHTIIRGATSRKCVPLVFKDVDMVPLSERRQVWSYEFDPNVGLVFRIYVPYLVIADVDGFTIKQIFYKAPLIPRYPAGFSEAEVREIIYTTHAWCGYAKSAMSKTAESIGDTESAEKPTSSRRRRRKSPRSDGEEWEIP
jgi:hypothetical protein